MRWGKTAAAVAAISCGVLVGSMWTSFASGIPPAGQPGSAEDPVVTKSYVDELVQKVLGGQAIEGEGAASPAGSVPYTVIVLKPGQTVLGKAGTEFNVRTGKALITSNTSDGVPDLTDGVDLKNGVLAPNNHLLQIPREGRGLKVEEGTKGDVYVTVKGEYTHIGADGKPIPPKP